MIRFALYAQTCSGSNDALGGESSLFKEKANRVKETIKLKLFLLIYFKNRQFYLIRLTLLYVQWKCSL